MKIKVCKTCNKTVSFPNLKSRNQVQNSNHQSKLKVVKMNQNNNLVVPAAPVIPLDYSAIQRAANKLAATLNIKCGFHKHDPQELAQELVIIFIEQAPTFDPLKKATPLTRAVNTLNHNLKFKGDGLDYSSSAEQPYSDGDDDFSLFDHISLNEVEIGKNEMVDTLILKQEILLNPAKFERAENIEIGAAEANCFGAVSSRSTREKLQKAREHFAKGDFFGVNDGDLTPKIGHFRLQNNGCGFNKVVDLKSGDLFAMEGV
jgi:hypothetical protein